ncbi:DUF805 domain-containing protein [Novosphingobium mangrovi (ex Huang et al. 2023)]|uniref:DUF805 domain-containing protein n=1 Tax=Novosphingobium mangrovi (ex Huang et al. 2023) TaxID=2976432 RepID=A0ABT2I251_9SPHN|nr:DUF805 domain-containing protein [Novosphingobium mangrovi (ex Huang et al. 2023)]MCT2398881.1 DUF805 domain-containing protein [Novosphingobium mangrovi (ex Huang et al. 2023)]
MLEYMIMPFYRYADFSGRARRMEFWSFAFLNFIVTSILVTLAFSTGFSHRALIRKAEFGGSLGIAAIAFFAILAMYSLAVLIPLIATNVRRLHDRNMSGWWCLAFVVLGVIPVFGWIGSIAYLVIMFLPGTAGPNRYGEDPKAPDGSEVPISGA